MVRPRSERRRRIVVNSDLQVALVARIAGAFLASLLLFLAISLGIPVALGAMAGVPDWGMDAFRFRVHFLVDFVALPLLSGILVLFAAGIHATFGVAGPLVRFGQVFRDLAALRIPRGVRIRKGDTLQQTARLFDASLIALHDQVLKIHEQSESALRELEARIGADPELAATLATLESELRALNAETGRLELLPRAPYDVQPIAQKLPTPGDAPNDMTLAPPAAPLPTVP